MEKLTDIVKKFSGNVVCIGVTDGAIVKRLNANKAVSVYMIERDLKKSIFSRRKKAKVNGGKKVNMKKLRKTFKKKSVDYIICNLNEVYDYFKYFIYDSVYINKKKLYIYGDSKYIDPNRLAKRFTRYRAKVEVTSSGNSFLIVVDNSSSHGNWLQSKWYILIDSFHNLGDMISVALTS